MAWAEVEDPTPPPPVTKTAPEDLPTPEPADEDELVWLRHVEGLAVHFLFQLYVLPESLGYGMSWRDDPDVQGFRTVNVTEPDHPYTGAWWPPGHILGYEHTFVHTIKDLMDGIKAGKSPAPTFEDGYRCQAVLDAVERSAASGEWRRPEMEGI